MRVLTRTEAPRPGSLEASEGEDWLDEEIASLRELVEDEAGEQGAQERSAPADASRRRALHRSPLLPMVGLRRMRWFVRAHRFDIVFYALGLGITLLGVGVVLWTSGG
jgi:hypothetical protein